MSNKTKIKKILSKLNDPRLIDETMRDRQERLRALSIKWGIEDVALACGYTTSTLSQYLRVTNPRNIGEESIVQAELVFAHLSK